MPQTHNIYGKRGHTMNRSELMEVINQCITQYGRIATIKAVANEYDLTLQEVLDIITESNREYNNR